MLALYSHGSIRRFAKLPKGDALDDAVRLRDIRELQRPSVRIGTTAER
jgi:hypothetical protein